VVNKIMPQNIKIHHLEIDGQNLSPEALWKASLTALDTKSRLKISIHESAKKRILLAEAQVKKILAAGKPVYGINTGFGKFAEVTIENSKLLELQRNFIASHCMGVGPILSRDIVMCMWILRLNTICRGNSGVRLSIVDDIILALEKGLLADVPSRGSVGASGDLAPSAHATRALLGEGFASFSDGEHFVRTSAAEALKTLELKPLSLGPKEALSLVNGTQTTTALALKNCMTAKNLVRHANLAATLSLEGLRGSHAVLDERIHRARNHPGSLECAQQMRNFLGASTGISESHKNCGRVQDPYSLRCAAQVHGAVWDEVVTCEETLLHEINSSTDNPLLFPEENLSLSGGNFHAIYTARVSDKLASALTTLSSISERRLALGMNKESSQLPHFLIEDGGFNSGFMMAQVTAAALVSENKSLSFPASVDSIPTSGDREDHVSMGPGAGYKAEQIALNTTHVLSIEILAACQALDLLRPLTSSHQLEGIHNKVRSISPMLEKDRSLSSDIEELSILIQSGNLLKE